MTLPPNLITNRTAQFAGVAAEYKKQGSPKRNKYRAVKTQVDGYAFDSKMEAERYGLLKAFQQTGAIKRLTVHPRFLLRPATQRGWDVVPAIVWTADFAYEDEYYGGKIIVEDVKGCDTREAKIKHNLFREKFPDYDLQIIRGKQ